MSAPYGESGKGEDALEHLAAHARFGGHAGRRAAPAQEQRARIDAADAAGRRDAEPTAVTVDVAAAVPQVAPLGMRVEGGGDAGELVRDEAVVGVAEGDELARGTRHAGVEGTALASARLQDGVDLSTVR